MSNKIWLVEVLGVYPHTTNVVEQRASRTKAVAQKWGRSKLVSRVNEARQHKLTCKYVMSLQCVWLMDEEI